jgi:hypothetical protein
LCASYRFRDAPPRARIVARPAVGVPGLVHALARGSIGAGMAKGASMGPRDSRPPRGGLAVPLWLVLLVILGVILGLVFLFLG